MGGGYWDHNPALVALCGIDFVSSDCLHSRSLSLLAEAQAKPVLRLRIFAGRESLGRLPGVRGKVRAKQG